MQFFPPVFRPKLESLGSLFKKRDHLLIPEPFKRENIPETKHVLLPENGRDWKMKSFLSLCFFCADFSGAKHVSFRVNF